MVLAVSPVESMVVMPPKKVREIISGLSKSEQEDFFRWLDNWIQTPIPSGEKEKKLEAVLTSFSFAPDRVREIIGQIQAGRVERSLAETLKLDKPIIFYDLETTGLATDIHRIVEISLIKIHPDGQEEKWVQRINPEMPIQEDATKANGIKNEDVKDCPTFKQLAPAFFEFFKDCHLAGFNIIAFDNRILQKEFERAGLQFSTDGRAIVDPMYIYHRKVPYKEGIKRNLAAAYKFYCDKDLENAHTAKADALATIEVLKGQLEMYGDLPHDVYKLADFCQCKTCDFVDKEGKFIWENGVVVFNFGRHRDKSLMKVIEEDPGYLQWMLGKDFGDEVKELITNAMSGKLPEEPKKPVKPS